MPELPGLSHRERAVIGVQLVCSTLQIAIAVWQVALGNWWLVAWALAWLGWSVPWTRRTLRRLRGAAAARAELERMVGAWQRRPPE